VASANQQAVLEALCPAMGGDLVAELATDCKIQEKRGLTHNPIFAIGRAALGMNETVTKDLMQFA
jgi:hypothetical protein